MIKAVLLDAANTIIHKPLLWERINTVLVSHGHNIPGDLLKNRHKLVSELINFPDQTSEQFYDTFNAELLFALGIVPEQSLLKDLFSACTYLPWVSFADNVYLRDIEYPVSVLSNFNSKLSSLLDEIVDVKFDKIIISEVEKVRKPQIEFYQRAIQVIGLVPSEILYVGDSLKLDIKPAMLSGTQTCLIDRDNFYPATKNRINSFAQLKSFIEQIN
jgi:putative hydrolase of the HAD superfamily